jgi:predicted alpha/beta superfamily hydrolase
MLGSPTKLALLGVMTLAGSQGYARAENPVPPVESRVDTMRVAMPELGGRMRTVRVYVPKGYEGGSRAYPVIYLQDGQQLFAPGPFGDWLVDESVDELTDRDPSRAAIVVGVDNSEHRWDEYGPWRNTHMHAWVDPSWSKPVQGGEGDAYVHFLAETLKPMIDQRYRTLPDREHTAVGGSSMGGLIALWAGLQRPDVFSRVMAMSTAVWFAESGGPWLSGNRLVNYAREHVLRDDVRFYLDVGTNERSRDADPGVVDSAGHALEYARAYVEGTEVLARALREGGVPARNLKVVVDPGAMHHETAWSRRFEDALLWLFR